MPEPGHYLQYAGQKGSPSVATKPFYLNKVERNQEQGSENIYEGRTI
jgi:hypothetical protein